MSGNIDVESTSDSVSIRSSTASGQIRKFGPSVGKPGQAREAREAVRHSLSSQPARPHLLSTPVDYENFITKNQTALENDPQRDLLLFPRDDLAEFCLDRHERTEINSAASATASDSQWLLTQQCIKNYSSSYRVLAFNYAKFGGDYDRLSENCLDELPELTYETDIVSELEQTDYAPVSSNGLSTAQIIKSGYLLQLSDGPSLRSGKKRHCSFTRESGGRVQLNISKDQGAASPQHTLVVESVKRSSKKNKCVMEVFPEISVGAKQHSVYLSVDSERELESWINVINEALDAPGIDDTQSTGSGAADNDSLDSEDSRASEANWRGLAASRALKPPAVDRRDLFALYPDLEPLPSLQESCLLLKQNEFLVPEQSQAVPFVVDCKDIALKVPVAPANAGEAKDQQIEPFFVRMYLLDTKAGCRISEEFHVDINSESIKTMLNRQTSADSNKTVTPESPRLKSLPNFILSVNKSTKALFSVPNPHPEIYLIARIERVLQNENADVYCKLDPKITNKHQKSLSLALSRLAQYRMAFAWTARPVFHELLGNTSPKNRLPLYRSDPEHSSDLDLVKNLQDMAKSEKASKVQPYPGASIDLNIDLSIRPDEIENRLTANYLPIKPFSQDGGPPIQEIETFADTQESYNNNKPYMSLFNVLYVYPLSLRFDGQRSFAKSRNIVCWVQIKNKDKLDAPPLQLLYSRAGTCSFVSSIPCAVHHHQQTPSFSEEIKIELPLNITPKHHLLFSFAHVSVTSALSSKATQTPLNVQSATGYSWLPLVKNERLTMDKPCQEFALPVAENLPEGYLSCESLGLGKGHTGPDIRWVEGGKQLFKVKVRLVSSVMSTEVKLHKFFQAVQRLERSGLLSDAGEADTTKVSDGDVTPTEDPSIKEALNTHMTSCAETALALLSVSSNRLMSFLPVVLNQLLNLLPIATTEEVALSALRTLVGVVDSAVSAEQTVSLRRLVCLQLQLDKNGVHSSLCKYLPLLLRPAYAEAQTTAALLRQSWFFFDVIVKNMALWLLKDERHKLKRTDRFPAELLFRIEGLVQTMVPLLISRHRELPVECRLANTSLAYFMRACLSLTDRGFTLRLVYFYLDKMDGGGSKALCEMKLEFTQILSQHEHWLPLCLPVLCSPNGLVRKLSVPKASVTERKMSVPQGGSGFLQKLLANVFGANNRPTIMSTRTADADLAEELSLTPGYSERHFLASVLLQQVVASLRDPKDVRRYALDVLLNLLAKHAVDPRYVDKGAQQRIATLYLPLLTIVLKYADELQATRLISSDGGSPRRQSAAMIQAIGRTSVDASPARREHVKTGSTFSEKFDLQEARHLLLCVLFVLRNAPEQLLNVQWQQAATSQLIDFISLLELSLDLYRYQGRKMTLRKTASKLRVSRRTVVLPTSDCNGAVPVDGCPFSVLQEANLAQEVALTVLDALDVFCRQLKERLEAKLTENEQLLLLVNRVYLSLLGEHWSEHVRLHTLAALLRFVKQFHPAFYSGPVHLLSSLSRGVLEQLCSRLVSVQRSSSALLQVLLRSSYEAAGRGPGLGRMGAQVGVALAHLLGEGQQLAHSNYFHRGLNMLEQLAAQSKKGAHFDQLVIDLVKQLRGIVLATAALRAAEKDPYKLAELHLKLADSYRGSAELRQAWMESLARLHAQAQANTEAALCHLHIAAIMGRELNAKAIGCTDWRLFSVISNNVVYEENQNANEVQEAGYTLDNFATRIEMAAGFLSKAERHEALGPLYRLILPIYEQKRDYEKLSEAYSILQRAYSRAQTLKLTARRALATYFRVIFYGQYHFGEEHGREWVYKEPGLTSLAEAAERLRAQCILTLGHTRVQLLASDAGQSQLEKLDEGTAYIQITHVEPVAEGVSSDDDYQLHVNVHKFRFETRLTETDESGAPPEDVTRQAMRRVFLTTSRSFAFVLRRLSVVSRGEQLLSPLQVALEAVQAKCAQLRRTLDARPAVDLKRLQLQLQGAVQTTVNAGPLAYAHAFTSEAQRRRYGIEELDKLKVQFRQLCEVCAEALEVNAQLIQADQMAYQQMLEDSFEQLVSNLNDAFQEQLLTPKPDAKMTQNGDGSGSKRFSTHVFNSISAVNDY